MKRMKKKVVAMVTLAMFMMTLLPMAAFAATKVDVNQSSFKTVEKDVNVSVDTKVDVELQVKDAKGQLVSNPNGAAYVWLEDEKGNVAYDVTYYNASSEVAGVVLNNGYAFRANADGQGLKAIKVSKPGTYTLKAGFLVGDDNTVITTDKNKLVPMSTISGQDTIVVTPGTVDKLVVNGTDLANGATQEVDKVVANDRATQTATIVAKDVNNKVLANKELKVESQSANLVLSGSTTTDNTGAITLTYKARVAGTYTVTVSADDYVAYLTVVGTGEDADKTPVKIETIKENNVVANNDTPSDINFADAVQFKLTAANGSEDVVITDEVVAGGSKTVGDATSNKLSDYATIVNQPDGATLDDGDFKLVSKQDANGEDVYTIEFTASATKNEIKTGKYTVNVALNNGDNANASFSIEKVGDPVGIVIDGEDTVKAGTKYTATVKFVDKNGIETVVDTSKAGTVTVGFQSTAVNEDATTDLDFTVGDDANGQISFKAKSGEEWYGSKVQIIAVSEKYGVSEVKEITVVDPTIVAEYALSFDATSGKINTTNTVKATLKDENDKVMASPATTSVEAYVKEKSVEDARVTVKATKDAEGKASLELYSDVACTADIVVAFKAADGRIYAETLKYTFGDQDIPADTSVVMTLGSTEMLVNNEIVDMKDAAPFAQDNRTFVPFRALGEALGAKVEYVEADKTVTYSLGSTEIKMTLGEKKIVVNGTEKEMDVAAFAKDGRTYVPVRFVGENLGFKVTGLTDANGKYVAVAFTK